MSSNFSEAPKPRKLPESISISIRAVTLRTLSASAKRKGGRRWICWKGLGKNGGIWFSSPLGWCGNCDPKVGVLRKVVLSIPDLWSVSIPWESERAFAGTGKTVVKTVAVASRMSIRIKICSTPPRHGGWRNFSSIPDRTCPFFFRPWQRRSTLRPSARSIAPIAICRSAPIMISRMLNGSRGF